VDYDPFDTAVKRDPYPFYAQRRRATPVFSRGGAPALGGQPAR
jgi:hypothetical protein